MGLIFQRRVGAAADAKELEYIIALHQTCMPHTRENATVSSLDVYRLLRSRYRISAKFFTPHDAAAIVQDLGGGDTVAQSDLVSPDASKHVSHRRREQTKSPVKKMFMDLLTPKSNDVNETIQEENENSQVEHEKEQSESSTRWTGHFTFSSLLSPRNDDAIFSSNAHSDSQAEVSAQPPQDNDNEAKLHHTLQSSRDGFIVEDVVHVRDDENESASSDNDSSGHGESSNQSNEEGKYDKAQNKNNKDLEVYLE